MERPWSSGTRSHRQYAPQQASRCLGVIQSTPYSDMWSILVDRLVQGNAVALERNPTVDWSSVWKQWRFGRPWEGKSILVIMQLISSHNTRITILVLGLEVWALCGSKGRPRGGGVFFFGIWVFDFERSTAFWRKLRVVIESIVFWVFHNYCWVEFREQKTFMDVHDGNVCIPGT